MSALAFVLMACLFSGSVVGKPHHIETSTIPFLCTDTVLRRTHIYATHPHTHIHTRTHEHIHTDTLIMTTINKT